MIYCSRVWRTEVKSFEGFSTGDERGGYSAIND
jgi:hypothetical protein